MQILLLDFILIFFHGHFRVADDGCQDIIEVMGNTPGKGSNGFHLLRLLKLGFELGFILLGLLAFGYINHLNERVHST